MYAANALFFPTQLIPMLANQRGPRWRSLVQRVAPLPEHHQEKIAFVLMMVRLTDCLSCETDCYRAMRGCPACAVQVLRRFKGSDDELLHTFETALSDVCAFAHHPAVPVMPNPLEAMPA